MSHYESGTVAATASGGYARNGDTINSRAGAPCQVVRRSER